MGANIFLLITFKENFFSNLIFWMLKSRIQTYEMDNIINILKIKIASLV